MSVTDRLNGLLSSVAIKAPCLVATTANITLDGLQTIDGVAVVSGNRVLVWNQTDPTTNGIYVCDTGVWGRDSDFNGNNQVVQGTIVAVMQGTHYGGTVFRVTTANPTIGNALNFALSGVTALGDGSTLTVLASGSTGPRSLATRFADVVNVKDFGATLDGVTDDTVAAQAAIDSLPVTGGDLFVPTGTLLNTGLRLDGTAGNKSNVRIFGNGWSSILKLKTSTVENVLRAESGSGFIIQNLKIDGNKANQTSGVNYRKQNGIRLSGVQGAIVENCWVVNCALVGIQAGAGDLSDNGSSRIIVRGCRMEGNTASGAAAMKQTDNLWSACEFISNLSYGFLVDQQSADVSVVNCTSVGNTSNGFYAYNSSKVAFDGNISKQNGNAGFVLDNASPHCVIAGNYAGQNTNSGIIVTGNGFNNSITGNTTETNGQYGIYIQNSGLNDVSGNVCRANSFSGISIDTSQGCAVNGNLCSNNQGSGIYFSGVTTGVASANLCVDNDQAANVNDSGLRFVNTSGVLVTGNKCYDDQAGKTQRYGASLEGTTTGLIIVGNDFSANLTAAMRIVGTNTIRNNAGYNPVGVSTVTPGASPWTYTAGASPETHYLSSGTVSAIKLGATQIFPTTPATVHLEPGESYQVTYTVVPTVIAYVH